MQFDNVGTEGSRSVFRVASVGVNNQGASVIRVRAPNGRQIEVATNAIGLAKLAEAGVHVDNDYRVNTGKV